MAVERRDAHRRQRRELLDAYRLVVVTAEPSDRAGQVREPAIGQPDLPNGRPLRAGDQPLQNLALDAGRQRGGVFRRIEEREQPADRAEQRRRCITDGDPGGCDIDAARPGGGRRRRLEQQRGDAFRAQLEHDTEAGGCLRC